MTTPTLVSRMLVPALLLLLAGSGARGQVLGLDHSTGPWSALPRWWRGELARVIESQVETGLTVHTKKEFQAWRARGTGAAPGAPGSWSQEYFDAVLEPDGRRVLLAMVAKLRAEQVWDWIGTLGYFDLSGAGGAMVVLPRYDDDRTIYRRLIDRGYGTWFMADRTGDWGLRSPRTGAQLHFRGPDADDDLPLVNVHVDLHNPGRTRFRGLASTVPAIPLADYAVRGGHHALEDLEHRAETHTADAVVDALREQGLSFPSTR